MKQIPIDSPRAGEESLFDLLIVVAENLKLLILGPVAVGLLALGVSYALPQSFTSHAILALPMPSQAAAIMVSPLVLDPVVESLNLSVGRSIQEARAVLANQIKTAVGKDGLLRLDVIANSPHEARAIANTAIDTWLKSTVPGEKDRADLEKRLSYAKESLESLRLLMNRLTQEGFSDLNKSHTQGETGITIIALSDLQARYLAEVLDISRTLQGLSRDVVKQPPTLPTAPVKPNKRLIVLLAVVGSGFALLIWVFMRQAWKKAARDPDLAEKQARLLAAVRFKNSLH